MARSFGALLALSLTTLAHAEVRYVSASLTTGAGNGTSWADAYRGPDALTVAIAASTAGDRLWVAAGRYTPTTTGDRAAAFIPKTGVTILGGFAGGETVESARNPAVNVALLTGDLAGNDDAWPRTTGRGENSYHLFRATTTDASGTVDGFTLTGGNADTPGGGLDNDKGGAVLVLNGAAPSFIDCRMINNRSTFGGGAVYIRQSSPSFTDCKMTANNGGVYGGACDMATFCNPVWTRCRIEGNTAMRAGGVEVFGGSQPVFTNCLFAGNASTGSSQGTRGGGGLFIQQSTVTVRNCTIADNTSVFTGGGILNNGGTVRVANCILWNNRGPENATAGQQLAGLTYTTLNCIVQDGFESGTGIITADPRFTSSAAGDYTLLAVSPAIDAGSNAELGGDTLDLERRSRRIDDPRKADIGTGPAPVVDIGCFERPYLCPADMGGPGGLPGADGRLDNNDFVVFIDRFFSHTPEADMGSTGGTPGADGLFDNNDFVVFVEAFFTVCL